MKARADHGVQSDLLRGNGRLPPNRGLSGTSMRLSRNVDLSKYKHVLR